ncbi:VanZ family protein [Guptibacillus algicola]|uniref:VanZ family protein n=1 Tax=Guptibacillus algicola TaxID=225844 RepID=UPI001CD3B4DF|nr:VanZ family protein [Alkalihalobacillus algicola]MCA0986879.1 VanZ family protein [Alkalihalobacillus algicola]
MRILVNICLMLFLTYIFLGISIITAAVLHYPLGEQLPNYDNYLPAVIQYGHLEVTIERNGQEGMLYFLIRKSGHFFMYSFASFFLMALIQMKSRMFKVTLVIACIYALAAIDEMVQAFLPERSSLLMDVVVDGAGGFSGIAFYLMLSILLTRSSSHMNGKVVG